MYLFKNIRDTQKDASNKSPIEEFQQIVYECLERHEEALNGVVNILDSYDQEFEPVPKKYEFRESSHLSNSIFP